MPRPNPRSIAVLVALLAAALVVGTAQAAKPVPRFSNIYVITLENESAAETFGPDAPRFLARKLTRRGLFAPNYYATSHLSLGNYISMISGQAPNPLTQVDCPFFQEFLPGTPAAGGQVVGTGCVYPSQVLTIADQLESAGLGWKGYMEDMANGKAGEPSTCRHPAIGARDDTQSAEVGDQYATRHNPFVYFHSVIDERSCAENDVDLRYMATDMRHKRSTAAYNFITPNLCHDGHDEPCVNGEPGGLVSANRFLRKYVPRITGSPAFQDRGLLVITFDEAEAAGEYADSSACCGELPGPNTTNPGFVTPGPGGGRVGAVMLSPCIRPGSRTKRSYNHYSLLRTVEDNFGLDRLGYAGRKRLRSFGADVLNRPGCGTKVTFGG
jgi:hypothetical protein